MYIYNIMSVYYTIIATININNVIGNITGDSEYRR